MRPIRLASRLFFTLCVLTGTLSAAETPKEAPKAKLPPELNIVPRDSMCMISLRLADLRDNKSGQWLFDIFANDPAFKQAIQAGGQNGVTSWEEFDKKVATEMGVDGTVLERVTFVVGKIDIAKFQNQPDNIPLGSVITLRKGYDRDKVLKATVPNAKEVKQGTHTYHHDANKHVAVHFLNDRSILMGTEASIKDFLSQPQPPPVAGVMHDVLSLANESALVLHINTVTLGPIAGIALLAAPLPEPGGTYLRQFLDLKGFTICADLDDQLKADLLLTCATERDQKDVIESLQKGLDVSRTQLPVFLASDAAKDAKAYLPLLKGTVTALKKADIRQEGLHLHVPLYIRPEGEKMAKKATPELTAVRMGEIWTGFTRPGLVGMRTSYHDAHLLASAPEPALKLLKERLKPAPGMEAAERKAIEERIRDLDSDEFDRRERATAELIRVGSRARPMIQARLDGELGSLEVRRRLERIMEKMKSGLSPEESRDVRALDVLEAIGTPEARELLRTIAGGEPGAPLTREAKRRLARLTTSQK
jgi:hypothetical protein